MHKLYQADGTPFTRFNKDKTNHYLVIGLVFAVAGVLFTTGMTHGSKTDSKADSKVNKQTSASTSNDTGPGIAISSSDFYHIEAPSQEDIDKQIAIIRESDAAVAAVQQEWDRRPILPPPPDAPPSRIKVGPFIYNIHYTSGAALSLHNALAETILEDREIFLNPARGKDLRSDVVHELLHCARDLGSGGKRLKGMSGDTEEDVIESMDTSFLQIIQDNPRLVAWLKREK